MSKPWFNFKQFKIKQEHSAFKVGTDGVLLGAWCNISDGDKLLDVGSGTGLIALMMAQRSKSQIVALEPDHLSSVEARANILASPWSDRIELIETSLQEYAMKSDETFDHIVSNPPFFSNSLQNNDSRLSSARHNHNLSIIELLKVGAGLLSDKGKMSVILPYTEGNLFIAEATDYGLYCNRLLQVKPLPGKGIKRLLIELSFTKEKLDSGFLIIETGKRHAFSHEYRELTKDYYLNF